MLILGALIALGPLTIDMYLPSLPTITAELLTTDATVQLTLTGTLLGLGLGQLVDRPALGPPRQAPPAPRRHRRPRARVRCSA